MIFTTKQFLDNLTIQLNSLFSNLQSDLERLITGGIIILVICFIVTWSNQVRHTGLLRACNSQLKALNEKLSQGGPK